MESIEELMKMMECKCGKRFSYEALYKNNEINFCSKCGRKKPKYLNEEFAHKLIVAKTQEMEE